MSGIEEYFKIVFRIEMPNKRIMADKLLFNVLNKSHFWNPIFSCKVVLKGDTALSEKKYYDGRKSFVCARY